MIAFLDARPLSELESAPNLRCTLHNHAVSKAAILGSREKPPMHPIDSTTIPDELRKQDRWLGWKWKWNNERQKWDKPPINALRGGLGSSTKPATWCSFDEALAAVQAGRCDGLGFALGEVDGIYFAGLDLDNCRNTATGELSELARDIIAAMDTYCEVSPTGTGIKLLCIVTTPPGKPTKNKEGTVEIYSIGRYFTITGQHVPETAVRAEDRQQQLSAVWDKYIGAEQSRPKNKARASTSTDTTNDDEVSHAALAAMFLHKPDDKEHDGSNRLFVVACRAVEHDLSDDEAIATIRRYAATHPFPTDWTDEQIQRRLRDAEKRDDVERGSAWRKIDTSTTDLAVITPLAWKALQRANNPPKLFRYGGIPSRIEASDDGEPIIKDLDATRMRYHLARAATWIAWHKSGKQYVERAIAPPPAVVHDVLATPDHPLPILSRIVEAPVFSFDGTLQTSPGYHAASQTYYAPTAGFNIPDVPVQPTSEDIAVARALICEELLGDFPFVGDAELAHAVALLLLPFARDLIDGATPLHLLEKPSPGTGATLLVDMLSFPAIGRTVPAMTEGRDEDEWRKRITAKLCSGSPLILIDNLRRRLDSAAVSAALTALTWEDRILGASEVARLPVRCVWMATGNNPLVSTEIARRCVRIRMDAKVDRPWMRSNFRHPNLRQWAAENRGQLGWAALTLIRAWIAADKPKGQILLGMYERWSEVIGGILEVAELPGFLTNLSEFYDETDAEGGSWGAFVAAWWGQFKTSEKTVKDLWQIVAKEACLPLGEGSEQSQRVTLGKMLAERRDRVFDLDGEPAKLMLRRGKKSQGAYRWQLSIPALAV